jgi:hypothetical protein
MNELKKQCPYQCPVVLPKRLFSKRIQKLAGDEKLIPWYVFLVEEKGEITDEDIEWARNIIKQK